MIDGKPRIGDEVYIHGYIDEIRNDVVIIRNEGGYFGTSDREMFYYEEDERGYGTMNEADRKTENSSEKPNNCEHITEDGVTCAKYPACDDCLDNPLNKVKGSERLLKGKGEPTISKMEQVEDEPLTCSFSDCDNFKNPDYARCIECKRKQIELKTEPNSSEKPNNSMERSSK